MAQVATYRSDSGVAHNTALRHVQKQFVVANGAANNGDNIEVHAFGNAPARLHRVSVRVSGSLGANATLTPQINASGTRTAIAAATTQGAASKVETDSNINIPFDLAGGEVLELAVGGANIGASATVTVDYYVSAK